MLEDWLIVMMRCLLGIGGDDFIRNLREGRVKVSDLEDFEELFRTVGIECDFIDLEKENYSRPDIFWEANGGKLGVLYY